MCEKESVYCQDNDVNVYTFEIKTQVKKKKKNSRIIAVVNTILKKKKKAWLEDWYDCCFVLLWPASIIIEVSVTCVVSTHKSRGNWSLVCLGGLGDDALSFLVLCFWNCIDLDKGAVWSFKMVSYWASWNETRTIKWNGQTSQSKWHFV